METRGNSRICSAPFALVGLLPPAALIGGRAKGAVGADAQLRVTLLMAVANTATVIRRKVMRVRTLDSNPLLHELTLFDLKH
jgi:hypothetical protein